jgi:hypothetical protein
VCALSIGQKVIWLHGWTVLDGSAGNRDVSRLILRGARERRRPRRLKLALLVFWGGSARAGLSESGVQRTTEPYEKHLGIQCPLDAAVPLFIRRVGRRRPVICQPQQVLRTIRRNEACAFRSASSAS